MRIIPLNKTTLFVLHEMPMSESMMADGETENDLICRTCSNEIVLYRNALFVEDDDALWRIERIDKEIERSDIRPGKDWRSPRRQAIYNRYFREAKSIMNAFIRENKIEGILRKDYKNEFLWA